MQVKTMNITAAKESDIPEILEFITEHSDYHELIPYTAFDLQQYVVDHEVLIATEFYAEGLEHIIGFLLAYDLKTWGMLDILCVHKGHRRQKIGSKLLEYVLRENPQWDTLETLVSRTNEYTEEDIELFCSKHDFKWTDTFTLFQLRLK